jgi:hypothetical protein
MSLWPDAFEENTQTSAKQLFEEQAKLLPKLTRDLVCASVETVHASDTPSAQIDNEFVYRFVLTSKFLDNYRFIVLYFSHDITFYPVRFMFDEKIGMEVGASKDIYDRWFDSADTPKSLERLLERVLKTERLKAIIGSIMRLSK